MLMMNDYDISYFGGGGWRKKPALYRGLICRDFIQSTGSQTSLCQSHLQSLLKQISGPHPPSEFLIH